MVWYGMVPGVVHAGTAEVDLPKNLHHFTVIGCPDKFPESETGTKASILWHVLDLNFCYINLCGSGWNRTLAQ